MKALIPNGFRLVALSEMPGTGSVAAKAFYNADRNQVFFVVVDPSTESEFALGPMETRVLKSLDNVIKDILEMSGRPLAYIDES
jgi:hypothetical protein